MIRSSLLILLSVFLGTAIGCFGPLLSQKDGPGFSSSPVSPVHSPDPLGKFERSMVFVPSPYPEGNWQPAGVPFEDAWFTSADGTRLHGWYLAHPNPRAVVLYCHGNGGNVAMWSDALRNLHDRVQVSVLGFDYRGYGRSEGMPDEAGVLADARAARAWLSHRAGVEEDEIVLIGRSLGGAVAIDLAASDGARALVLESTFTSLPALARILMPQLPVQAIMRTKFDSLAKIGDYRGPLMHTHGTGDRLIPLAMARELHAAANEPKQFIALPNLDHNDPQPASYYPALADFLAGQ